MFRHNSRLTGSELIIGSETTSKGQFLGGERFTITQARESLVLTDTKGRHDVFKRINDEE